MAQLEFVNTGNALVFGAQFDFRNHVRGKNRFQILADGFDARNANEVFDLRIPGFDAAFEIDGEDADVQRFNNVFAEIFQALDLNGFLFQRTVKLRIIQRDSHVTGNGEQKFHVVRRQEIAVNSFAEAEHGDGAFANAAGNVIVQIEAFKRTSDGRISFRCVA